MKKLLFMIIVLCLASLSFAQEVVAVAAPVAEASKFTVVAVLIGGFVFAIIEFIIGKTSLVKENSTLDLVLKAVMKIISLFLPKK